MPTLRIAWLFPSVMNTYGDNGNIAALRRRSELRGIVTNVWEVSNLADLQRLDVDLIVIGGAQDRDEAAIAREIVAHRDLMQATHDRGTVIFAVCAGYQLLGHSYVMSSGESITGLSLIDAHTVSAPHRFVGYVAVRSDIPEIGTIVGFENHGGRTHLGSGTKPLGNVVVGGGNNGRDGSEGVATQQVIGTYLHGPVLIANPRLTDYIISLALKRSMPCSALTRLDDALEDAVHNVMLDRALARGQSM